MLSACGGGGDSISTSAPGKTIDTAIDSTQTGANYGLQIYLPPDYEKSSARYPVIYAMDGTFRFNVLQPILQGMKYNNMILVVLDPRSSARRFIDYPMPGASAYYRFFTTELIPMIDAKYRTDPSNRTLSGHSLSAEFALFALYMEQPDKRYFSNYIVADCSCWLTTQSELSPDWDAPVNMERAMFERSKDLPVKIAMSGDDKGNFERANNVYQRMSQRGYQRLSSKFNRYNLGHVPMDGPAFAEALPFIFGPPPP